MNEPNGFALETLDYLAFGAFFVVLSAIGYWAGRKERAGATEYFLAGKKLPWYVIGGSFIASNISTEHFIGMIGAACVYGICVGMSEWMNVLSFSLLIWFFIPFLLASKVFTTPEFLERRFGLVLRQLFALVTIISNVVAFLAAVLYGGALAIQKLFSAELSAMVDFLPQQLVPAGMAAESVELWLAIIILGIVAGFWAIYGGLSSVAWTDLFTVVVMVIGGTTVTILGLGALADGGSLLDGIKEMIARNQASEYLWEPAVSSNLDNLASTTGYNRLSVFQPASHPTHPWPSLIFGVFSISIWYNVLNQFMIQRVLGARSGYDARMGIVLAGFLKVFLPAIVVIPGLILFALHPEILLQSWDGVRPEADQGYIQMLQQLVPIGLRGLFLAALFGAIQSTVNSVLNSTATIFTLDVYKRLLHRSASDKRLVMVGVLSSIVVLAISILLGGFISRLGGSLFVYIQTLYAFFAPPFAAVFLLGILWKRINSPGAVAAVFLGFAFGILMKVYVQFEGQIQDFAPFVPDHPPWLAPYANQAVLNWGFCVVVCIVVSLLTPPPPPDRITDQVTVNWSKLNIFDNLGDRWYKSVVTWWGIFVVLIVAIFVLFSGLILPSGVDGTASKSETSVEVTNMETVVESQSKLGEAPIWHPAEECLYWADIDRGQLHRYDPAQGKHEVVLQGRPIAGITYQVDGSLLLFRDRGTVDVYRNGRIQKTLITEIPDEVETRFNDVIADPRGRVFCGTLKSGDRLGRLYRLDPDGSYQIVLKGIGCSNGLGFTRDLKRMYYTDSTARTIWVFDYDVETGNLSNGQVFAKIEPPALPDGLTVDDEDNVWSAMWDGSCVVCYRPDGSIKAKVELPTEKITSVMFGGPEMSELYITSAGNDEASGNIGQAGDLFRIKPGVRGRREFPSRILIHAE
jgi:solute:Na+ symporter, SSS family